MPVMGRNSNAKERLFDAAIELIWKNSYGSVGVEEICREAGVQKGSFYYFFSSKAQLVAAALEANWQLRAAELREIFDPRVPPVQRIVDYFCSIYERQRGKKRTLGQTPGCVHGSIGLECSRQEAQIRETVADIARQRCQWFTNALMDGQRLGDISPELDPAMVGTALFCLLQGGLMQARIRNDPLVIKRLIVPALAMLGVNPATVCLTGRAAQKKTARPLMPPVAAQIQRGAGVRPGKLLATGRSARPPAKRSKRFAQIR